jgi:hypothetical protein
MTTLVRKESKLEINSFLDYKINGDLLLISL